MRTGAGDGSLCLRVISTLWRETLLESRSPLPHALRKRGPKGSGREETHGTDTETFRSWTKRISRIEGLRASGGDGTRRPSSPYTLSVNVPGCPVDFLPSASPTPESVLPPGVSVTSVATTAAVCSFGRYTPPPTSPRGPRLPACSTTYVPPPSRGVRVRCPREPSGPSSLCRPVVSTHVVDRLLCLFHLYQFRYRVSRPFPVWFTPSFFCVSPPSAPTVSPLVRQFR